MPCHMTNFTFALALASALGSTGPALLPHAREIFAEIRRAKLARRQADRNLRVLADTLGVTLS